MELALKFKIVSATRSVTIPPRVEADKPYLIMEITKETFLEGLSMIMMTIRLNTDDEEKYVLSPLYCVVSDNDISEINAEPGKYKLIYGKKGGCNRCYILDIEGY
jgi:hypothetical protein